MSVSSLTKMTTPLSSDQSSSTQGLLMPKLKYRFRVVFENFGVSTPRSELTKQVKDFKRPEVSFDEIVIDVYNSKLKLPGKPTWADVSCTLRDDASGSVRKLVGEQMQKQFDFLEQSSASSGIDFKFTTRVEGIKNCKWGLGWRMFMGKDDVIGNTLSPESFGHLGYTGTSLWIDPEKNLFATYLVEYLRGIKLCHLN